MIICINLMSCLSYTRKMMGKRRKKLLIICMTLCAILVFTRKPDIYADTQQFVHRIERSVGSYGEVVVCVVYNKNRDNISFNSWGKYSVRTTNGYSLTLVERSHTKSGNNLIINFSIKVTNLNNYQTIGTYKFSSTISK